MQLHRTGDVNDTFTNSCLRLSNYLKTSRSLPFVIPSLRHVYEIIREGYPCRLYFDLEFPRNENPNVDGDHLTCRWIELILWKLYEYFGLCLGFDSVVDLESSTDKKFSREHENGMQRHHSGQRTKLRYTAITVGRMQAQIEDMDP